MLSADAVVHELLESDELVATARERFGDGVIRDGKIDRPALAKAALADDRHRGWLEGMLWPRVGERIAGWLAQQCAADPAPSAIVIEVPLLFESGMDAVFDTTVTVSSSEAIRAARLEARGHAAQAARDERQLTAEEKVVRADHVIRNDETLDELDTEVGRLLDELRRS